MPNWQVLLIGGASGVGKSRLSHPLAQHLGVSLTEIDDFQVILETLTTPDQQPLLHFWRTNRDEFSAWDDVRHLEYFVRVSREVFQPALEAVIANRLESGQRAILEGDFILPELAARTRFGEQENGGRVRAIFVTETGPDQIAANYHAREGDAQLFRARLSWLNNEWLASECHRHGIPTLLARPWETVIERTLALL